MKTRIKDKFPFAMKTVKEKLGITTKAMVSRFVALFPTPYVKGRVSRYAEIPPQASKIFCLVGEKVSEIQVVPYFSVQAKGKIHYFGPEENCRIIVKAAVREWWSLPFGKELKTVAERLFPATAK